MFYDEELGSIILFGGIGESGVLGDTWELNLPEDLASFVVTQIPLLTPTPDECSWYGLVLAWSGSNGDGLRDADEPPLANIRFFSEDPSHKSEKFDYGTTGSGGSMGLVELLPGCTHRQFEVYPEVPENCQLTTPTRFLADTRKGNQEFSFGFLCH
jgi:hypothetical protein